MNESNTDGSKVESRREKITILPPSVRRYRELFGDKNIHTSNDSRFCSCNACKKIREAKHNPTVKFPKDRIVCPTCASTNVTKNPKLPEGYICDNKHRFVLPKRKFPEFSWIEVRTGVDDVISGKSLNSIAKELTGKERKVHATTLNRLLNQV